MKKENIFFNSIFNQIQTLKNKNWIRDIDLWNEDFLINQLLNFKVINP